MVKIFEKEDGARFSTVNFNRKAWTEKGQPTFGNFRSIFAILFQKSVKALYLLFIF